MTPESFCYWLQGMLEDGEKQTLSAAQLKLVREHLALVFAKKGEEEKKGDVPSVDWAELMRKAREYRREYRPGLICPFGGLGGTLYC